MVSIRKENNFFRTKKQSFTYEETKFLVRWNNFSRTVYYLLPYVIISFAVRRNVLLRTENFILPYDRSDISNAANRKLVAASMSVPLFLSIKSCPLLS